MGVSHRFPSDSQPWSEFARIDGEPVLVLNGPLVATIAPLIDEALRRRAEVDDEGPSPAVDLLRRRMERVWADTSSSSTPPLPRPDARERKRIDANEAARRLGVSRVRVGQRCRRGDFRTADQDARGRWWIDADEIAAGSGGRKHAPPDPAGGDR